MARSLSDLTSAAAVQAAMDEYAQQGQAAFLKLHGFGKASGYVVRNARTGEWADSKAIAGVSLAYQYPGEGILPAASFSGGEATVVPKLRALGFEVRVLDDVAGTDWTREEVSLIVADYLAMLTCELVGQTYNKTAHRRQLISLLSGRSEGSIEFKHANISAVMLELGFPYLRGYKPRSNFQRSLLVNEVCEQVSRLSVLDEAAMSAAQRPAVGLEVTDLSRVSAVAPRVVTHASEPSPAYLRPPIKRDYLERESQNRSLGLAGEEFALRFEQWRLSQLGSGQFAEQVVHVSKREGDGLGYDIRSFEPDGRERFIEVKTTGFGERTPFFVSSNELAFSKSNAERFHVYRVFDFRMTPRLFQLHGAIDRHCQLDPTTFRASFG